MWLCVVLCQCVWGYCWSEFMNEPLANQFHCSNWQQWSEHRLTKNLNTTNIERKLESNRAQREWTGFRSICSTFPITNPQPKTKQAKAWGLCVFVWVFLSPFLFVCLLCSPMFVCCSLRQSNVCVLGILVKGSNVCQNVLSSLSLFGRVWCVFYVHLPQKQQK